MVQKGGFNISNKHPKKGKPRPSVGVASKLGFRIVKKPINNAKIGKVWFPLKGWVNPLEK
jgi:hypothetical protein